MGVIYLILAGFGGMLLSLIVLSILTINKRAEDDLIYLKHKELCEEYDALQKMNQDLIKKVIGLISDNKSLEQETKYLREINQREAV